MGRQDAVPRGSEDTGSACGADPQSARAPAAQHAVELFREHDEAQLQAQYAVHHDEAELVQTTQQAAAQLRELFEADVATRAAARGAAKAAHGGVERRVTTPE